MGGSACVVWWLARGWMRSSRAPIGSEPQHPLPVAVPLLPPTSPLLLSPQSLLATAAALPAELARHRRRRHVIFFSPTPHQRLTAPPPRVLAGKSGSMVLKRRWKQVAALLRLGHEDLFFAAERPLQLVQTAAIPEAHRICTAVAQTLPTSCPVARLPSGCRPVVEFSSTLVILISGSFRLATCMAGSCVTG